MKLSASTVPRYGKLEIAFAVSMEAKNPCDPDQIEVLAVIRKPSGREDIVPAFFFQDFSRQPSEGGGETLKRQGAPGWRVRYAPTERGEHSVTIEVYAPGVQHQSRSYNFRCVRGAKPAPGFLRVGSNDKAFEFDDGTPYFPVGLNTCWGKSTFDYDRWFEKLAENGGNCARLWLNPMFLFALETKDRLGHYNSDAAWRVDYVLNLAEKYGIRLMFCIESFNSVRIEPEYPRWNESPYNTANGGPCATPSEFFSSPVARKLFLQRLRYIVARWGYSSNVFCWELWNEVDLADKYDSIAVRHWHVEMARYLKDVDPNRHLVSTSFANSEGDSLIDALPEIDFVQTHNYGANDLAAELSVWNIEKDRRYKKPHFIGEFGLHWQGTGNEKDKSGSHIREAIWASAVSRSAGTGMTWWWDTYIDPQELWQLYKPLSQFVADVEWNRRRFKSADPTFSFATPQPPQTFNVHVVGRHTSWVDHASNSPQRIKVRRDGSVEGAENLSTALHGTGNHPTWHNPLTISVDGDTKWKFAVTVKGVSDYGGARLKIWLDGIQVRAEDFKDDSETRTGTMNTYDGVYGIDVPPGAHEIKVFNDGVDWVNCSYQLLNYGLKHRPALRAVGVQDESSALLWLQNEKASFRAESDGERPSAVEHALLRLNGLRDGAYRAEFWDCGRGKQSETIVKAQGGRLFVPLPAILKDLAIKLKRQ